MPKTLNYSEGDCFLVNLRKGGYARGVVARTNGKGIVFGYFFGPRIDQEQDARVDTTVVPRQAIFLGLFGDLGLIKREWAVVGKIEPWCRDGWPMPPFVRAEEGGKTGFITYYDEDSLLFIREEKVPLSQVATDPLPDDGLWGYGAIEIRLTKLLG